ncbi:hypothetical protein B5F07_17995 [Lachnoclostridium sp. An169]|uniref:ABC transporter permease n=1 Tax=Lachnoclostridium sp. An169 TaxID=1965569 RepID=UPI000B38F4EE|nr:ABC-2 family transporter protein [Lachnoclostridium sp. An169]OUP81249.1 hypothetical protein B5F07_17995 [Lachnoclostridium sp. An169]
MGKSIRLFFKFFKMHLLSKLEYKGWWLAFLQQFIMCIIELLPTVLMFYRMGSIGEWSMERILLIYSLAVISFGIAEAFCDGFANFPWKMLRSGDFDRLLLRPKSLILQVAGSVISVHRLTRAFAGIGISLWALNRLEATFSVFNLMLLLLAIIGGTLMYSGIFIMSSGIAFFTIKALDWINIFTYASYQITRIPVPYMPGWIRGFFTFIAPLLVVSYYPAAAVCGWEAPYMGLISLPAGALFFTFSLGIWRIGVAHYKSTGS